VAVLGLRVEKNSLYISAVLIEQITHGTLPRMSPDSCSSTIPSMNSVVLWKIGLHSKSPPWADAS